MVERLPESVRTPQVARAVTSPSAVLLAGAGMAGAVLAGAPLALAAGVGALAWAARVALAVPRRRRRDRVDPFSVSEPWRGFVKDAQRARARFGDVVDRCEPGPLRDRLRQLAARLDHGVEECWRIARQGDALDAGLGQLDSRDIEAELARVRAERRGAEPGARAALERAEEAIHAQLASVERMSRVSQDARSRLRLINAQLDEAVARALELSLGSADAASLSPLSDDVESLVGELESLREAIEETRA